MLMEAIKQALTADNWEVDQSRAASVTWWLLVSSYDQTWAVMACWSSGWLSCSLMVICLPSSLTHVELLFALKRWKKEGEAGAVVAICQ